MWKRRVPPSSQEHEATSPPAPTLTRRPAINPQIPAIMASVVVHLALLAVVGTFTYAVGTNLAKDLQSNWERSLDDYATPDATAIADIENTTIDPVEESTSPVARPRLIETPPTVALSRSGPAVAPPEVQVANRLSLPSTRLDAVVSIRGAGAEHVGDAQGALDRIAVEIMRSLERGPTLVVWTLDASGSLQAERQRLANHVGDIYRHIAEMDREKLTGEDGLLTAVVGFGQGRKELVPPTADVSQVQNAFGSVPLDESGIESTFQTVIDVAGRYGSYQRGESSYRVMVVIVTDEVGDDESQMEPAINAARSVGMPVYVLGSPALFGRVEGLMDYKDPRTGQTFRNLPVRAGPESVVPEVVRLPFWYSGPQYEYLDAGFGPWALSRLARQTGGIYFITRIGASRLSFNPDGMKEYAPDWDSREQVLARFSQRPLQRAVTQASGITQQNLPTMPSLVFPAAESPEFKDVMARNQELVARVQYTVDEALRALETAADARDHEPERRWRAHYDLIRGRLLAVKLRCFEYNTACARMKLDLPKFEEPGSNAWRMVPDTEIRSSTKAAEAARDATALLERVIEEHPGTPWAVLAQRELKDPFGFRWVETRVEPPRREEPPSQAKKKREAPQRPPAQPPKL